MEIRLRIEGAGEIFKPGSMVKGGVELTSATPVEIEEIELRLSPPPGCETIQELTGKLSRGMLLDGTITLPLAASLDGNAGRDADGPWTVEVEVSTSDGDEHRASTIIQVATGTGQKIGGAVSALLIALPFLTVGALGMGFGIGGVPEKIIPEGVLWFGFVGGILATLAARAILGAKDAHAGTPWLATPLGLILLGAAGLGVYCTMLQPDLIPLRLNMVPDDIQSIFAVADGTLARQQIMGLFTGLIFATAAGGLFSRKAVPAMLQAEIAFVAAAITCTFICLGFIGEAYRQTAEFVLPALEFLIPGLVGAILLFSVFKKPVWTKAPVVTLCAGCIPLSIGLLGLAAGPSGIIEAITAAAVAAWGGVIMYLGGRNILVSAMSGRVDIQIAPSPVSIGETIVVQVKGAPIAGVRLNGATAILLCEQHQLRYVRGDLRPEVYEVHRERKHIPSPSTLAAGEDAALSIPLTIPLGSRPSESGSRGVFWTIEVTAHFGGRPDHVELFDLVVTS